MKKQMALLMLCCLSALGMAAEGDVSALSSGLESLYQISDAQTRSISAENPTGQPGNGAKAIPDEKSPAAWLGEGWKVRPSIDLKKGETVTLAQIDGPGIIQHIWLTTRVDLYRDGVIRFYWDGEKEPSVEAPLGDFFAEGHGVRYNVNSLPVVVNPTGGFNCYWPMPFRKSCRITIENQGLKDVKGFFYQITYALTQVPQNAAYFHAQWRRTRTTDYTKPEHVILDGVKGKGHYVGTFLAWTQFSDGWWGEGEIKFFMDGDTKYPTICGTGTEDYFGGAWCFKYGVNETYSTAYMGYPYIEQSEYKVIKHALYRWHVMDPIRFSKDMKVTIQALGWYPSIHMFEPLTDDICSTAYWYQIEPHQAFPKLPEPKDRWPR